MAELTTKTEATDMMPTYLGDESDGLAGFEFLTMAEAGGERPYEEPW